VKNFGRHKFRLKPFLLTQCETSRMQPVLPDGIFSHQKSQFEYILEGLGMGNVGTFYGHTEYFTNSQLVYFMAVW
jgi:hypothetical protein